MRNFKIYSIHKLKESKAMKKNLIFILTTLILTSCGGGGSSAKSGIPSDFDLFSQDGIWRLTTNIQTNFDLPITISGTTVNSNIASDIKASVVTANTLDGSNLTLDSCDAELPITIPLTSATSNPSTTPIPTAPSGATCASETTDFKKISDTQYEITYTCDGTTSKLIYKKLSSTTDFNFGNLSFTSSANTDLDTNSVCGRLSDTNIAQVVTPQPNDLMLSNTTTNVHSVSVAAPYNGNLIEIVFDFSEAVAANTYIVTDGTPSSGQVHVRLTSATYGGTSSDPDDIEAISGNVSISIISEFAAEGAFAITTETGDVISGDFHFDIE
jgi:hypothetical protein